MTEEIPNADPSQKYMATRIKLRQWIGGLSGAHTCNERSCMNKAMQFKTTQLLFDVVCMTLKDGGRTKDMCTTTVGREAIKLLGNETTPDPGLCKRKRALTGGRTSLWIWRAMPTGTGSPVSSFMRSLSGPLTQGKHQRRLGW